jgi:hypothetical protein
MTLRTFVQFVASAASYIPRVITNNPPRSSSSSSLLCTGAITEKITRGAEDERHRGE